ncbi:adenylate kinase [Vibrio galatheae]|uniref:Adenylate kinase n=1 Tax=Vibrio galatheae TaxID=579748 RepID=A0A0F4NJW2_9VIBR|nr:adenylate kinase [Vibrio galatheae]KJY83445.1 adenylate kinase [Vibrio galatheae]
MKKIAVFGKPGSGKSTLSKQLAVATGIPLYPLDSIVFKADGSLEERTVFDQKHRDILVSESWIIDGLGPVEAFKQRLEVADTLIYIDLPYWLSYWLVTKRMLKGLFIKPEGWPEGSSIVQGTLQSYKFLKLSRQFWNESFEQRLNAMAATKSVYIIRSLSEMSQWIEQFKDNCST